MSNRTIVLIAISIVMLFVTLVIVGEIVRDEPAPRVIAEASSERQPILPIPSVPDTAAPIITTSPPDTTAPSTTKPRPRPTTTTEPERELATDPIESPTPEADTNGDDIDIWLAMGRCEQPGNEWGGVRWSHPGPTYQGGLGFWHGTWDQYKRGTSAASIDNAGQATPMQQIEVARKIRDKHGYRAWGCAKKIGV